MNTETIKQIRNYFLERAEAHRKAEEKSKDDYIEGLQRGHASAYGIAADILQEYINNLPWEED